MIQPKQNDLSREELLQINLKQAELIEASRLKIEKLQKKPTTNLKNSSQPPSQDQKPGRLVN